LKITLVNPGFGQSFLLPPLGLAYIAAVLRKSGYSVNVIDTNFHKDIEDVTVLLKKSMPDVVGITCMTPTVTNSLKIASLAKKISNSTVFFGGPHPTILPATILRHDSVDYVIMGEGELTVVELLDVIENNKNVETVQGVIYKSNDSIKKTDSRPPIQDLDSLPFPARDLLPKEYFRSGFTNMIAGRGCMYNCSFCQPTLRIIFGSKLRMRSPQNIVDEMEELKEKMKIKLLKFDDDTLTLNKKWVFSLCDEIIKRKVGLKWECNSRVNTIDKEKLLAMKKAGCTKISFGVESGSQMILNRLNKGITVQQSIEAFKICKEVNMRTHAYLMIGSPGETISTINETIKLINTIDPDEMAVAITNPLPMTHLWNDVYKNVITDIGSEDWSKYDYSQNSILSSVCDLTADMIRDFQLKISRKFWVKKVLNPIYAIRTLKAYPIPFLIQRVRDVLSFL
jgi:radical SAM superfamily enzyme YgiQ (UPF0313 family)